MNSPFAATSWSRGTSTGIIAASAGAKKTVTIEKIVLSTRTRTMSSPTATDPDQDDGSKRVRDHEHRAAGRSGRRTRRRAPRTGPTGTRKVRNRALTAVRQVARLEDDDGQGVQDHVDPDLGRDLRRARAAGTAGCVRTADRGGAARRRRPGRSMPEPVASRRPAAILGGHAPSAGRGRRRRSWPGSPRVTKPSSRASRSRRSSRTCRPQPWQRSPMSAPRRSTSHSLAAARMRPPEADDVAQEQLEHGPGGHRRERIRGGVRA